MDGQTQAGITSVLVSTVVESLIYGAYVVTHCVGMWILLWKPQPESVKYRNIALLVASTLIFAVATTHFILAVNLLVVGFASPGGVDAGPLLKAYNTIEVSNPLDATRFAVYVTQTLLADLFLVYRLYVVWDRKLRVIVGPLMLIFVDALCGYLSFLSPRGLIPAFYFITFLTNVICSGLIIHRILLLRTYYRLSRSGASLVPNIWRVASALIESAALYSVISLVLFIAFFASPEVGYPACANIFTVLIGFIFSFVVIRVALRSSRRVGMSDSQLESGKEMLSSS